eukprot:tig00000197_g15691.t1
MTGAAQEKDLYDVLGVRKDATADELKAAYRRIVLSHHPDRHLDEQKKELATAEFHKIQYAYGVLSDPNRRELYDRFGHDGLKAGMEVGPHLSVDDFLKMRLEKEQKAAEQQLEARLNQHGTFTLSLDARKGAPIVTRSSAELDVQMPISRRDLLILGAGVMNDKNSDGMHSLQSTYRRQFGRSSHGEVTVTWSRLASGFSFKGQRNLSLHSVGQFLVTFGNGIGMTVVAIRQLGESTSGTWSFTVGNGAGLSLSYSRRSIQSQLNAVMKLGALAMGTAFKYNRLISRLSAVMIGLKLNLRGVEIETGGSRQLSPRTSVSYSLVCGMGGVSAKLKFVRGGSRFIFPVYISSQLAPLAIAGGLLVPAALAALVKKTVLAPMKRAHMAKKAKAAEPAPSSSGEAKREAQVAVKLMEDSVEQKRRREESVRGLVIERAIYGHLHGDLNDPAAGASEERIDVTVPCMNLVENSQLHLYPGSKASLLGFYDPAPEKPKFLVVEYKFKGRLHRVSITDDDQLVIPMREHLLK